MKQVKKGQVYEEQDKRAKGRRVKVVGRERTGSLSSWRVENESTGRQTTIRTDVLRSRFILID